MYKLTQMKCTKNIWVMNNSDIKILKERKTPLQSKHKIVMMMKLFERYIDEEIISINISNNTITTYYRTYFVDIHNNKVKISYPDI
jgi:hypothetical protein